MTKGRKYGRVVGCLMRDMNANVTVNYRVERIWPETYLVILLMADG